jgi:hypothetical protein
VQEFEVESDEGMTASGDKQTRSIIGKWSFKTECTASEDRVMSVQNKLPLPWNGIASSVPSAWPELIRGYDESST